MRHIVDLMLMHPNVKDAIERAYRATSSVSIVLMDSFNQYKPFIRNVIENDAIRLMITY